MLELTHSVSESPYADYLVVKDTTTLQEYADNDINIETDIVSVEYLLIDTANTVTYVLDVSSYLDNLRDSNGLIISNIALGMGSKFTDGKYISVLRIVEDSTNASVEHTSEVNVVLHSNIEATVYRQIKTVDWQEYIGCYTDKLSTSVRKRQWLESLKLSNDLGLVDDAYKILKALEKICL